MADQDKPKSGMTAATHAAPRGGMTGADAKRMANQAAKDGEDADDDRKEGETVSDAQKRRMEEESGVKRGSATAESVESGAMMEKSVKEGIDLDHPAVDSEPRKGLPAESDQIDFNDPTYPTPQSRDPVKRD